MLPVRLPPEFCIIGVTAEPAGGLSRHITLTDLSFIREGAGDSIVLLHGLFGGTGYWQPLINRFKDCFDLLAVGLPGFAGSSRVPQPASIEGYGQAIFDFLDRQKLERFTLVGHSLGGAIGQQMALDRPHRIERLVNYATKSSAVDDGRFETFNATVARLTETDIESVARMQIATWFVEGRDVEGSGLCCGASVGVTQSTAINALSAIRGWDVHNRLVELKMPVLIISGDRDRSVSVEEFVFQNRQIEQSQLCILPGCAHIAHLEMPEPFHVVLRQFLSASIPNVETSIC